MKQVFVIVEGQTEEAFIKCAAMKAIFAPFEIYRKPRLLGVKGHQGGRTNYARVQKDIVLQLKQDRQSYCTTMIDFYGLGGGFPGIPLPTELSPLDTVRHVEKAWKVDICQRTPDLRPELRFIPFICLHEFEALLFTDPSALAEAIGKPNLAGDLGQIRAGVASPEDINDSPDTAPSKRILKIFPSYRKVLHGTEAAQAIGILKMRDQCPHFASWISQLLAITPIP